LLNRLDQEFRRLADVDEIPTEFYFVASDNAKMKILRHPYMAGHLRGDFRMSPKQLCYFTAKRLRSEKGGARPTGLLHAAFECVLEDTEELPLFEDGERFTDDLEEESIPRVWRALDVAVAGLSEIAPASGEFVNTYLWKLALRTHRTYPNKFGSRSFQCLPGLALFCNPDAKDVSSLDFEEALLHETIHSFLFFSENDECKLLGDPKWESRKIVSPWTGASLDLHTGVHALIVWLALAIYWALPAHHVLGQERAEHAGKRLSFVRRGLESTQFRSYRRDVVGKVAPAIADVIEMMTAKVRSRT
jgi:hypothetical protein